MENNRSSQIHIFIGGTGRSGTTILSEYLGTHQRIRKIPFESRFIIDKNGMIDLYRSLHSDFSIDQGRIAIRQFEELIQKFLLDYHRSPYLGHPFPYHFGKGFVIKCLEELVSNLTVGTFSGNDYHSQDQSFLMPLIRRATAPIDKVLWRLPLGHLNGRVRLMDRSYKSVAKEKVYVPRYFPDENKLAEVLSDFVLNLFSSILREGEDVWCEDTPSNILNLNTLSSIFPEAKFVHVLRNPVGVVYSYRNQRWAPADFDLALGMLKEIYTRILKITEFAETNIPDRFKVVKLEDLPKHETSRELANWLGVDPEAFDGSVEIKDDKINYYWSKVTKDERQTIKKALGDYAEAFGYAI